MKFRKAYALAGAVPFVAGLALAAPAMASPSAAPHAVHAASSCQVPGVVFDPAALAVSEIRDAGLNPVVRGPISGAFVNTQSPVAGKTVACGSSVTIVTLSGPTP